MFGRKKKEGPKRKMRLVSFRDGLQTIPDTISKALGDRFIKGCSITSVKRTGDEFEVTSEKNRVSMTFRANKVVIATPAWVTANIIHPISELAASYLMDIEYIPVAIIFTGFKKTSIKRNLDGFGFLIPSKETKLRGYNLLGSIWSSAIYQGRAPEDMVAFTNMIGGARNTEILEYKDPELIDMTLKDLKNILNIEDKPEFIRIIRQPRAIPQYTLGHQERINTIKRELLDIRGLYLAGNYINGVSVGHCIAEATKLAKKISTGN